MLKPKRLPLTDSTKPLPSLGPAYLHSGMWLLVAICVASTSATTCEAGVRTPKFQECLGTSLTWAVVLSALALTPVVRAHWRRRKTVRADTASWTSPK